MADITVGGKGFEGVIATFNTSCVTNIKITPTVDWVDFTIETNTVNARVEAYTGDNTRQQSFTLSFTALTENDNGSESETACAKNFSIEQLSKNFHPEEGGEDPPTPEACTKFIVDGGSINAEKEGDEGCDSAYLYGNPTAVYSPSTASSWVHISFVYYDTDPRRCCTDYARFPEVAYEMQDEAGVPHDLTDHNLGTVRYTIDANGDDEDRSCEVWFIVDNVECTSKKYVITQSGGDTPSEPCDVKLTLSGLEGTDKATINWGDGKKDNNVGNEQKTHTYSTGGKHTASISADGYKQVSAEFDCDGTTEISKTMEKGAGDCDCDTMILVMGKTEFTLESAANSQDSTIVSWNSNCPPYIDNEASSWLDAQFVGGGDGDFEVNSITKNDSTEDRVGIIKIYANSSKETVCRTLTVTQKHGSGGGTIDKDITIVMTTTPPIFMNSIQYKISLEPKETGQGTAVTLHDYDWFINEPCTDNPVKWTNNFQKTIRLTGSYTGDINLYNFKVDFQNRTLKKQNTSTLQCDGSETTATGTMRGIGSDAVEMNASNGYFLAPLTSESNIGTSINIALR